MFSGKSLIKKIRRMKKPQKKLHDYKELVALDFSNKNKYDATVELLKKSNVPFRSEDLVLARRLIVPVETAPFIKGFISRHTVITKEQLSQFVQLHLREKSKKVGWHGHISSPALKAILHYRYFILEYVKKHISLYAEALRISKFLPKKS